MGKLLSRREIARITQQRMIMSPIFLPTTSRWHDDALKCR